MEIVRITPSGGKMEIRTITPQEFLAGNLHRITKKEADRIAAALVSVHIQLNWPNEVIEEWMWLFHHTDSKSRNGVKVLKAINDILVRLQRKGRQDG